MHCGKIDCLIEYNFPFLENIILPQFLVDIINIKPATGEDGDFAFYCNGVDMYFVCRINITDKRNCFEILYDVKEEFWNQGYMTEALKAFCKWLFHNTDQNIIWALPGGIYKEASIKVLKKCNFIRSNREADQDWYELRRR